MPMPWPDVPVALKQGVITALDHTDMVCDLTRKFEVAKYCTQISYAKGLFIWIFNKAWFKSLPEDLQQTFKAVVREVCAEYRTRGVQQEAEVKKRILKQGVRLLEIPENEMAVLRKKGDAVHNAYAGQINRLYSGDSYRPENYLEEVQTFLGYGR